MVRYFFFFNFIITLLLYYKYLVANGHIGFAHVVLVAQICSLASVQKS